MTRRSYSAAIATQFVTGKSKGLSRSTAGVRSYSKVCHSPPFFKRDGALGGDVSSQEKSTACGMAEYVPLTDSRGNLRGICPTCDRFIHRVVSRAKIEAVRGKVDVTFTEPSPRIRDTSRPSVSCDFKSNGEA
jgi:hypothetical protein